ncbi:MAG: hypothetical protein ABI828_01585 [Actinomycetota bacterium]
MTRQEMVRKGAGNPSAAWQSTDMLLAILIMIALVGVVATWGATLNADAADVIQPRPQLRRVA